MGNRNISNCLSRSEKRSGWVLALLLLVVGALLLFSSHRIAWADEPQPDDAVLTAQASESESNNTIATADSISLGETVTGTITEDDKDHYKFTLPSAGRIKITGISYMEKNHYTIYDANGKEVWSKPYNYWNSTTSRQDLSWTVDLAKGAYYFCVERCSGTGNYNFKLAFTGAGESFAESQGGSNNTPDTASKISLNTSYKGQIAENDDKDFYRFVFSSAGRIKITGISYMEKNHYTIYDANGKEMWSKPYNYWNSTTSRQDLSWTVDLAKGAYYFCVERCSGTGNYNFKLAFTGAGESFAESQGGSNNTPDTASKISLNTSYKGQIAENDDKDFYRFALSSAREIRISGTAYIERSAYRIYDASGNEVWSQTYNYWNGTTSRQDLSWTVDLAKGTYYFCVERSSGTGNYNFKIVATTSISSAKVSKISKKYYTGKQIKPSPTVKVGGKTLKAGTDYSLSYSSNKTCGTATVTITGKGGYVGEIERTFVIAPAKVTGVKAKAKQGRTVKVSWSAAKARKASADGFRIYYKPAGKKAQYLSISGTWSSPNTTIYIPKGKKVTVKVQAYTWVNNKKVYGPWSKAKTVKIKN